MDSAEQQLRRAFYVILIAGSPMILLWSIGSWTGAYFNPEIGGRILGCALGGYIGELLLSNALSDIIASLLNRYPSFWVMCLVDIVGSIIAGLSSLLIFITIDRLITNDRAWSML